MNIELQTYPIKERFDHLLSVISSQRFLRMEGILKEVPFFVAPFKQREALKYEKIREQLINKLKHKGIRVLDINLYDITKELLDDMGDWEYWINEEARHEKSEFLEAIQSLTDAETKLVPAVVKKMESSEFNVMFISGVGEVFPYIRSHTVLNNLQRVAKAKPTVMFFPGDYSHSLEQGASLDLFGKFQDDKYYRAYNIFER